MTLAREDPRHGTENGYGNHGRENVMRPPLDRTAFTVTVLPDDPAIEEKRIGWGISRKNRKRSVRASRRRKGMSK